MRSKLAALLSFSVGFFFLAPAQAGQTQKYVARWMVLYDAAAHDADTNSAISFLLDAPGVRLNAGDVSISIGQGSRFQSSLDNGTTLKITPVNGSLGVGIIGNIRSVNPPPPQQFAVLNVTINRAN